MDPFDRLDWLRGRLAKYRSQRRHILLRVTRLHRAAARTAGVTLAFFFGFLSVLLTIGIARYSGDPAQILQSADPLRHLLTPVVLQNLLRVTIGSLALSGALTWLIAGSIALASIDPAKYSHVMLSGKRTPTQFRVLAIHSCLECARFYVKAGATSSLHRKQLRATGGTDAKVKQLKRQWRARTTRVRVRWLIWRLKRLERKQHKAFQRIAAMKEFAASQMGVSVRRLCDHMLQYSPWIHRNRAWKYRRNLQEMVVLLDDLRLKAEVNRLLGLVRQNVQIREQARKRFEILEATIRHSRLHDYIYELWSAHSTSGSLLTYAHLLSGIAETLKRSLWWRFGFRPGRRWHRRASDKLAYAYRKQQAYPGFDLHESLLNLLRVLESRVPDAHYNQEEHANAPDWDSDFANTGVIERQIRVLERMAQRTQTLIPDEPLTVTLQAVQDIRVYVTRSIAEDRDNIVKEFERDCRDWFKDAYAAAYVVTHGYSKTVREAITRGLPPMDPLPYVYLLVCRNTDEFDTRLMEYEISERLRGEPEPYEHLASGEGEVLLRLLNEGDKVLVVLGAECFDTKDRVVHPRGMVDYLEEFVAKAVKKAEVRVIVLAEEYKGQRDLANTKFYDEHFDRVSVYDGKNIDSILSG